MPAVLRWAADLKSGRPELEPADGTKNTDDIRELRKEKLRKEIDKLRLQADACETALMKERGALHDADACERQRVADGHRVANAIQIIPSQVVSIVLSHGMPHEASAIVQDQIGKLCNTILRLLSNEGPSIDEEFKSEVLSGAIPS